MDLLQVLTDPKLMEMVQLVQKLQANNGLSKMQQLLKDHPELSILLKDSVLPKVEATPEAPKVETAADVQIRKAVCPVQPTILNNAPSGKNRRIKDEVRKVLKKQRNLIPEERSAIIEYMNKTQDLLPHDDGTGEGICIKMCVEFNNKSPNLEPVYPYQIAGYYSHLCRMALKDESERDNWFQAATFINSVLPYPVPKWTKKFIAKVYKNWKSEKEDRVLRLKDHRVMLSERKQKGVI